MTLREINTALRGTEEVELTTTGRKSGRKISNPVWFVQNGDRLYLLPVRGSDSHWYKNARKIPAIGLKAGGTEWIGSGTMITDAAPVNEVVEQFRAKYGADQVRRYYSKLDVAVEVPLSDGGLASG